MNEPNVITMSEYRNADDAIADVEDMAREGELLNAPPVITSNYVSVEPHTVFKGAAAKARITIKFDPGLAQSSPEIYMASRSNQYVFAALDTTVVDGQAVAQTDQGGIFVVGSRVNYNLVIGLSVAGVVLVIVILMVVSTVIYFVVRPEKWKSTKAHVKKTQMKVKRSFAKQV